MNAGDVEKLIKDSVKKVSGYTATPVEYQVKLNQNESPYPVNGTLREEILSAVGNTPWSRYPSSDPIELRQRLAAVHQFPVEGIVVGNGSDELIVNLYLAIISKNDPVLTFHPTFTVYDWLAKITEADSIEILLHKDLQYHVDDICNALETHQPKLLMLANPNNPTGAWLPVDAIQKIVQTAPGIVAIDEAYIEFTREPQGAKLLIRENPNLVILRTFSKAVGGAGLRLGYCLADPVITGALNKVRMPFNLNAFARLAGERFLGYMDNVNRCVQSTVKERERVVSQLEHIKGIQPFPTHANFILFACEELNANEVYNGLLSRGVLIRNMTQYPLLEKMLRVTIGLPEENDAFLGALEEVMQAGGQDERE